MCGRYGLTTPEKMEEHYGLTGLTQTFKPRYNVSPTQKMPVIDLPQHVEEMYWGLIPFWARDIKKIKPQINARAEGIENKPMFRKPFRLQRCLVPATGFFEWKQSKDGKIPYYFKLKNSKIFSFAGLYDIWKNDKGEEVKSYTIITTMPNETVGKVHNRMPVMLEKEGEEGWINPDETEPERLLSYLKPFPDELMESYPVSTAVNIPSNDVASILEPLTKNSE